MKAHCGLALALALSWATSAVAEPRAPRQPGVRYHDGFFARLAIGPTMVRDSFEGHTEGWLFGDTQGTVTGYGHAQEIAIGGSVAPGLSLAGAVATDIARTTDTEYDGYPVSPEESYAVLTMGPMVDYYPDPEGGFHLNVGVGLGVTSGVQPKGGDGGSASGLGMFAGAGYDFWIADQWALGFMGRAHYVTATETIVVLIADSYEVEHRALAFGLFFTATYN